MNQEEKEKVFFKAAAEEKMKLLADAYNYISALTPTKDIVPMFGDCFVVEVDNVPAYEFIKPYMRGFVSREYSEMPFEGNFKKHICDYTEIKKNEKIYLAFGDKYIYREGMTDLAIVMHDYFHLLEMKYCLEGEE